MKKYAALMFVLPITFHAHAMLNLLPRQIVQLKPAMRLGACNSTYRPYNQSSINHRFQEGKADFSSMKGDVKPVVSDLVQKKHELEESIKDMNRTMQALREVVRRDDRHASLCGAASLGCLFGAMFARGSGSTCHMESVPSSISIASFVVFILGAGGFSAMGSAIGEASDKRRSKMHWYQDEIEVANIKLDMMNKELAGHQAMQDDVKLRLQDN